MRRKTLISIACWSALLGAIHAPIVHAREQNFPESQQFKTFESYKDVGYDQPYRPLFHFTSLKNWINDPNGLVYYDGEYHLFFQHNPLGTGWKNMTWGHAVSTDMVRWKQRKHAILPYGNGYPFSGTGVVDHNNSLGKQLGDTKTLVLIFSYALDIRPHFGELPPPEESNYYQAIAYSTDKGHSFQLLNDGGPVIPNQGKEIDPKGTQRDPKLFWHEASEKWVTLLWMGESSGGKVGIFTSDNLRDWKRESIMVRKWAHECFDLMELPVLDADGQVVESGPKKWLIYDGNFDYEIGNFDGKEFTTEQPVLNHKLGHWNAAQTFNNMPSERKVVIGWLKKSDFYRYKMPFTEQLTFPATMHIRDTGKGIRLYRWPIKEIETLYGREWSLPANCSPTVANEILENVDVECSDMSIEFRPVKGEDLVLDIRGSRLSYDADKNHLTFISKSNLLKKPIWDSLTNEARKERGNWRHRPEQFVMLDALNKEGTVKLRILVDRGSIEIFLNEGITVLTHSETHDLSNLSISLEATEGVVIQSMVLHAIKSSWESIPAKITQ